jgi:hypothetical protein
MDAPQRILPLLIERRLDGTDVRNMQLPSDQRSLIAQTRCLPVGFRTASAGYSWLRSIAERAEGDIKTVELVHSTGDKSERIDKQAQSVRSFQSGRSTLCAVVLSEAALSHMMT